MNVMEDEMIALVIHEGGLSQVESVPVPEPEIHEALVRVRLAGISTTDLQLLKGHSGFTGIPGHEFVGEVVLQAAEVVSHRRRTIERTGLRRVVADKNIPCNYCDVCNASDTADNNLAKRNHCPNRKTIGISRAQGVMAQYVAIPHANLHPIPMEVPDHIAIFAEPLSAALRILEQSAVRPTDKVAVLGDGKLGWIISLALAQYFGLARRRDTDFEGIKPLEPQLTIIGKHPENARRLLPHLDALLGGSVNFIHTPSTNTSGTLVDDKGTTSSDATKSMMLTSGTARYLKPDFFDACVEATGSSRGILQAVCMVKPRGTVVLKTTVVSGGAAAFPWPGGVPSDCALKELNLVGSRCGPLADALEFLATGTCSCFELPSPKTPQVSASLSIGRIHSFLEGMTSATVKLHHAKAALAAAASASGTLKVMLDCRIPTNIASPPNSARLSQ